MEASDSLRQKKKIFFVLYLTHPHGLRHMYATVLIEMEVPLVKISALLGHSSVHTTFEYYCDVMDENEHILAFMNNAFVPVETDEVA